jgi:hypothetical protein
MVSHIQPSSDRANGRSGAGNGHGKAERTPGTPRKDGGAGKEKAVQDPGLKDYVGLSTEVEDTSAHTRIASWRMPWERCFWIRLQSFQLGNWRGCCCEAD